MVPVMRVWSVFYYITNLGSRSMNFLYLLIIFVRWFNFMSVSSTLFVTSLLVSTVFC